MRFLLVAASLALAATLGAQAPSPSSSRSPSPPASREQITFANSGPAAAQPAFLRAVAFLHNFEYDEAIAAFREVQGIAPRFALAYWGEALCYSQPLWYNENVAKAREALGRLAPTPSANSASTASR